MIRNSPRHLNLASFTSLRRFFHRVNIINIHYHPEFPLQLPGHILCAWYTTKEECGIGLSYVTWSHLVAMSIWKLGLRCNPALQASYFCSTCSWSQHRILLRGGSMATSSGTLRNGAEWCWNLVWFSQAPCLLSLLHSDWGLHQPNSHGPIGIPTMKQYREQMENNQSFIHSFPCLGQTFVIFYWTPLHGRTW